MYPSSTLRIWIAVAALLGSGAAAADEALWKLLPQGGQVVLVRHATTTPGVGDPEGMQLQDCASQRNLSDAGRQEARRLGAALRARGVAFAQLYASPWCRCLETARLVLGREPVVEPALGNLFGRPELRDAQLAALRPLVSRRPAAGNVMMVTHGSTTLALTGVSPAMGEMVILTPRGDGFSIAGRLALP